MRFAETLTAKNWRVSERQEQPNDYEFTLGGKTYYMDAKIRRKKNFLTFAALEELKKANKKIALLEKRVAELTIKNIYRNAG